MKSCRKSNVDLITFADKDSLDVLDYRKTVGLPKTVKDDKSNDVGMDPFNSKLFFYSIVVFQSLRNVCN